MRNLDLFKLLSVIISLYDKHEENTKHRVMIIKNYVRQIKQLVSDKTKVYYNKGSFEYWLMILNDLLKKHKDSDLKSKISLLLEVK